MVDGSPTYDPDVLESRLRDMLDEKMYHCIDSDTDGCLEVEFSPDVTQDDARGILREVIHHGDAEIVMSAVSFAPLRYVLV